MTATNAGAARAVAAEHASRIEAVSLSAVADTAATYDPYEAANDNIAAAQQQQTTPMPADRILGWLFTEGHIGQDERDAGEHMIKLASIARSPLTSAMVRYTARDADRKWRPVEVQRHTIRPALDKIIESIRYEPRRKATVQAFVVDETNIDLDSPHRVAQGLSDVARYLWGRPEAVTRIMVAANDNQPQADKASAKGGVFRVADNLQRMHTAKNLDDDPETNDALFAAGLRYAQDHHQAGLSPLGAVDYSRVVVDGGGQQNSADSRAVARDRYRAARELLGSRYGGVVEGVAVEGKSLGEVGAEITRYRDRGKAIAAAGERLNAGLRLLAVRYGILRS
ncbi:hypothetical protein [Allomesorhizobium camelthorni]|uniref:Uncharacterized protein n=1 Tax=Allomesorhizobium camelthorni TaxID=475069 RepID=A0A6G4WA27_9HYPH|nr:hypothetical protein [Mesorhizobium camelthorni]NGO51632.1 hypothetical protein [Mesorhizobium camelthorni]